jgi:asparagine synthase (glutamine-hydrolysing)
MCGITGRIGSAAGSTKAVIHAINSISHRGPDDQGFYVAPGIELGVARLAIIDITGGSQPKKDSVGQIHLVFNGEIYNLPEIRTKISSLGGKLTGKSEVEALIELYRLVGDSFVTSLRGMFAIALWDSRDRSLFLARDRMGEKPLIFHKSSDGTLVFASEMRAIFAYGISAEVNVSQISNFLRFGYLNAPNTIVNNVQTLPPAHFLKLRNGCITISPYWHLNLPGNNLVPKSTAIKYINDALEGAVISQLVSERPLGIYLSGGIDSTLVTYFAVKNSKSKLNTFTIGFENVEFDESKYASEIARYLDTNHNQLIIKPEPELLLNELSSVLDQPFADSSIIPTFLLNKFASNKVAVALGGDGGDEVMGGYDRYRAVKILQKYNSLLKIGQPPLKFIENILYRKLNRKQTRILDALAAYKSALDRYIDLVSLVRNDELASIIHPSIPFYEVGSSPLDKFWKLSQSLNVSEQSRFTDLNTYLPGDLLYKSDIASMANGVELRSPFLDYKFVEISNSIPDNFRITNHEGKHLLKEIARSVIPSKLIERPKMGFGIPRAEWLRGPLKSLAFDLLLSKKSINRGWINPKGIENYWNLHQIGRDSDRILWPVLMLELWARRWVD